MGSSSPDDGSMPLYLKVVIALVLLVIGFIVVVDLLTFVKTL